MPQPKTKARLALRGVAFSLCSGLFGCDEPAPSKPKAEEQPLVTQSEQTAAAPGAAEGTEEGAGGTGSGEESAEKKSIRRPKDLGELILTPQKRSAVEAKHPQARGFLDVLELEKKLYDKTLKRGTAEDAVKAFEELAKGKWVLFVGNIVDPEAQSFKLPVRYTPRDPQDKLGLTATWFPVSFESIEGFDAKEYRPGELALILARYEGGQVVKQGYDLIFLEQWPLQ